MSNKNVSQFELRKKLQEALQKGNYLITVTFFDEDTKKLQHYITWENFNPQDVIPSLGHLATVAEKDIPYDVEESNS